MPVQTLPSARKARLPVPVRTGSDQGFASVASELDAIFSAAPRAVEPARRMRRAGPVQSFVGSGAARGAPRHRLFAAAAAVAASAALGVCAGLLAGHVGQKGRARPAPPAASAPLAAAPAAIALPPPPTALDAEAAAPAGQTLEAAPQPEPSAETGRARLRHAARAAAVAHHAARARGARGPGYAAVLAADQRLRAAYSRAVRAGAPHAVLVRYRNEWAQARSQNARPGRLIASYAELERGLDVAARGGRGHRGRR